MTNSDINLAIGEMDSRGYVSVTYPHELRACVLNAMDSWKAFCTLSDEAKRVFSGGDRVKDFGYMRRFENGPRSDNKELFHVSRKTIPALREQTSAFSDQRAIAFINAIDALLQESAPLIHRFADAMEKQYHLEAFAEHVMSSQDNWTFRYLHYFGGNVLAHAHVDRGGFTLHLNESDEGGEYFDRDGAWQPLPISSDQTIIFPGMELQHRAQSAVRALWHRVQSTQQTEAHGRYSMVAFIDFGHDYRVDGDTYRMQDMEPGFNYSLSDAEFQKFFVQR